MKTKTIILLIMVILVAAALGVGSLALSAKREQAKIQIMIASAEASLAAGDAETALASARDIMEKHAPRNDMARLHYIQAVACEKLGKNSEALKEWQAIHDSHASSEYGGEASVALGMAELARGSEEGLNAADALFHDVASRHPGTRAFYMAQLGYARIDVHDGRLKDARDTLLRILDEARDFPRMGEVEALLGGVSVDLFRSQIPLEGEQIYTIQKGDVLVNLGKKFGVNYEVIMLVNGIGDPGKLRLGQQIKIPKIKFSIVVNKSENALTLLNNGKFFKKYKVRTGERDDQTPSGDYTILYKEKDPKWDHDGRKYEPYVKDPQNELGTRWLAFKGRSLGIHGTIHPESLGQYSSQGCVGMLMSDVEELYDLIPTGTPVKIVGERKDPRKRSSG